MSTGETSSAPDKDELKRAFKAFKKKLKLTRLDEESKISASPLTKGQDCGIVAVMPPPQFSPAVWEELVKQGRLKNAGHGMYQLAGEND